MKFFTRLQIFSGIIIVGIIHGIVISKIIMPLFGNNLIHCIITAWLFGFVNYVVIYRIYKKSNLLKQSLIKLKEELLIDKLTGLYNRRAFEEDIKEIDTHSLFSMIFIDIDNFKNYNDKYGHQTGDKILKKVSKSIRLNVRSIDRVYRYGGEEIIVLLKDCTKDDAFKVAEKIRLAVHNIDNSPLPNVTISLGVSNYPADGSTVNEVINACDFALLKAKRNGKNQTNAYVIS